MDSRIAERRNLVRRERMLRRRRSTVAMLVVLVLGAVVAAAERSALVALSEVEVTGTDRPEVVREAAGLELGTSTLRLRLSDAVERVESLPAVRSATARRTDPLTVRIDVVERKPVAVITSDDRAAVVDEDGVVIARGQRDRLPVIAVSEPLPDVGSTLGRRSDAAAALAVLAGLTGPLRSEVVRYVVDEPSDVVLALAGGATVRFGRPDRVPEKARVLGAIMEDVDPGEGWTVDVRAPDAPVVAAP
jgi:cell division protein FtsQ